MSQTVSILLLLLAAALEALGDAVVRKGMHAAGWQRGLLYAAGAVVLFLYGWTVNRPPWKFGELLGLYVVFFFLLAQAISIVLFREYPPRAVWIGGAFIAIGGGIIAAAR
jgi:small multidrug resistance family-3 protein